MEKIGILTFYNTINYGASLQTFALFMKVKELGCECEVIRYRCSNIEKRELVVMPKYDGEFMEYIKNIVRFSRKTYKRRKFKNFLLKNVNLSENEFFRENIAYCNNIYDKLIVGSDMVFELGKTNGDITYYLDFADNEKRYSYAASLGGRNIPKKFLGDCIDNLKKFKKISVREEQTKLYLSDFLDKDIRVDLDPTLLHKKNFWEKYEKKPKKYIDEDYILIYFLDKNNLELETACKIACENNWSIKIITSSKMKIDDCEVIYNATIEEFLYYIHHARLVITGSFHGMALSITYNTNFMYCNEGIPLVRLDNLAKLADCMDRKLKKDSIPNLNCDFKKINLLLDRHRKESLNYLKSILDV